MVTIAVVIPWRDSGDPHRRRNAEHVAGYYRHLDVGPVIISGDGADEGPFNRHRAYNRGYVQASTDVVLWNEADTLIPRAQIEQAADLAMQTPGLVLPYDQRYELDPRGARLVWAGVDPFTCESTERVWAPRASIGQAGITSRTTMQAIGGRWPEQFAGWGYDDDAMVHVFATLAGPTRWVAGRGVHLWHPLAYQQQTPEQRAATERNERTCRELVSLDAGGLRAALTPAP